MRIRSLLLPIILLLVSGVVGYYFVFRWQRYSGINIDTIPKARVYLNGKDVGVTPYVNENLKPGDYKLRLSAVLEDGQENDFQTQLKLIPGTIAVVNRVFGKTQLDSWGVVISFDKINYPQAALYLASNPDALVRINNVERGLTPQKVSIDKIDKHELTFQRDGYASQSFTVVPEIGYQLNVIADLGSIKDLREDSNASSSAQNNITSQESGQYATVSNTPTGFLRMRFEPSINSVEVGQVLPGESYPILASQSGWVKIKTQVAEGWVTSEYIFVNNN